MRNALPGLCMALEAAMRSSSVRSGTSRPARCAAVLIVALTLAACSDPATTTQPTAVSRATANRVASAITTPEIRPPERHLYELASEIPGFGGYFIDSSGVVVGYVTDLARGQALQRRLETDVRAGHIGGSRTRSVTIRKGQFDFPSLARWRDIVSGQLLGVVPGVVMSDADEAANRVTIGIDEAKHPGVRDEALRALVKLGVPANAVRFITFVPPSLDVAKPTSVPTTSMMFLNQNLGDVPSPLVAGYRIYVPEGWCTLGPVVVYNGNGSALTASHCSSIIYGLDGTQFQTTNGAVIGSEVLDPSPTCGSKCRRSDATLMNLQAGVPYDFGRVARTTDVASNWGVAGSLNVDQSNPTLDLIDEEDAVAGMTVQKTGARTGTTIGYVTNTCVDESDANGYVRACSFVSTYYADGGDSGAPVYSNVPGTGEYRLVGMHWGHSDINHNSSSSYFYWVRSEIGGSLNAIRPAPPSVYIDGPSDVSNSPSCRLEYQAVATAGAGGYTYSWDTDGVIDEDDGDIVFASFPGSGDSRYIEVTVTDAAGATATAYFPVDIHPYGDEVCYI